MDAPATMPLAQDKALWTLWTLSLNAAHSALTMKPAIFRGKHSAEPPGILDAYREGDLCFDDAVAELLAWKARA